MSSARSKSVLITGASSGIGLATAKRLAGAGWTVYATARRIESLAEAEAAGCKPLVLDVTDEASMVAAVAAVEEAEGAVGVLINNAGYGQLGAVESVSLQAVRDQFETNVFGLLRLTQLVMPKMRQQGWGKIVNISSMGGKVTFPGFGVYHASKYAVEALSDALRYESKPFGIDVICIEPGIIKTKFADASSDSVADATSGNEADGPYAAYNSKLDRATKANYENALSNLIGGGPDTVAKAIENAITAKRAPSRKLVTPSAYLFVGQRRLMPDRLWDAAMAATMPRPKRK